MVGTPGIAGDGLRLVTAGALSSPDSARPFVGSTDITGMFRDALVVALVEERSAAQGRHPLPERRFRQGPRHGLKDGVRGKMAIVTELRVVIG
jgi:hypothetical protein